MAWSWCLSEYLAVRPMDATLGYAPDTGHKGPYARCHKRVDVHGKEMKRQHTAVETESGEHEEMTRDVCWAISCLG